MMLLVSDSVCPGEKVNLMGPTFVVGELIPLAPKTTLSSARWLGVGCDELIVSEFGPVALRTREISCRTAFPLSRAYETKLSYLSKKTLK